MCPEVHLVLITKPSYIYTAAIPTLVIKDGKFRWKTTEKGEYKWLECGVLGLYAVED